MLNESLVKVRKERGLTQEALAVKLSIVRKIFNETKTITALIYAFMPDIFLGLIVKWQRMARSLVNIII